jgi:hypothetical protein
MKKIPCLFQRDFTDKRRPVLLRDVTPGCEWVLAGEGVATRKWDGAACAIINGELYARYDAKNGKPPPLGAIPCDDPDPITSHWPHWVRAIRPEDLWLRAAWPVMSFTRESLLPNGTYEACGPKIGGNPERLHDHILIRHGRDVLPDCPRDWDGLSKYLHDNVIEGVVFHHPDGRMVKIRRDDFGYPWKNR